MVVIIMDDLAMLRLWQLISPTLPVGAYAYSGGMESAVEQGQVVCETMVYEWVSGLLTEGLGRNDLPMFFMMLRGWQQEDLTRLEQLNQKLQAMRETKELLAEDRHMGLALQRLLHDLGVSEASRLEVPSFVSIYSLACHYWHIESSTGAAGLAWSWMENQIAAAIKLVPLGQTAGQRLLQKLSLDIHATVNRAANLSEDELGQSLPGLALLSAAHENQYSRIFRS
ncbi:MAG: urease accessory UreF family protein [Pseudomonadota bacterium]